jgi:hypothetical protein
VQIGGTWVSKETMKNNKPKKDEENQDSSKHQNKHNPDENV